MAFEGHVAVMMMALMTFVRVSAQCHPSGNLSKSFPDRSRRNLSFTKSVADEAFDADQGCEHEVSEEECLMAP